MRCVTPNLSLWSRLKVQFRQVNTWLIIALLALAGWTVDSWRMFLSMHETPWAGLRAFASHFWYAVPMAVAIVALTRLRPRAKLLGLTTCDEAGRLLYQKGDFHLDELTAKGMLAALRDNGPQGLHGITLPSGASVYFVREGGLTLMVSFSRPASPRELAAEVQKLRSDIPSAFHLLDGLEPPVAVLAANVLTSPTKRNALAFFYQYSQTAMGLSDLAYWVGQDEGEVARALEDLVELGLVQRRCVCDLTIYLLNHDQEVLDRLDKLFGWQEMWQAQLHRLEQMIGSGAAAQT